MTVAVTRTASPESTSTCVITAKPAAAIAQPGCHDVRMGGTRRTIAGASIEPTMNATNEGSVHSPARNGESPATSCRYWKMKRNAPKSTRMPSVYTASDALNAGTRKSFRSMSGSASFFCRYTNAAPSATPDEHGHDRDPSEPVLRDLLEAVDDREHARPARAPR